MLGGVIIVLTTEDVYIAFARSRWRRAEGGLGSLIASLCRRCLPALLATRHDHRLRCKAAMRMAIRRAFYPFFESLVAATPYIFGGPGGGAGLPRRPVQHRRRRADLHRRHRLCLCRVLASPGCRLSSISRWRFWPARWAAALWGFIPGWLKAKTGGHEVINTIMMNYIAFRLSDWLLTRADETPRIRSTRSARRSRTAPSCRASSTDPIRFHLGFFVALVVACLVYWFLFKTTWGFELRTVGANPNAARYAGMSVIRSTVLAMSLSGALAGLAGANEVLGVNHNLAMAFSSGYGFDSIALALLGNSHPLGVVLAALLFGTLRNGATRMQLSGSASRSTSFRSCRR